MRWSMACGGDYTRFLISEIPMNLEQPEERTLVEGQHIGVPISISKARLMAALEASGMPLAFRLDAAKTEYPTLGLVRDCLDQHCGNGPGLCEFEGRLLAPVVPAALQDWPVWYVRLPVAGLPTSSTSPRTRGSSRT